MTSRDWGLVAAAAALIVDQGSKLVLLYALGFAGLASGAHVLDFPIVNLVMAWNYGVSFSFLAAQGREGVIALAALEMLGIGGLCVWLWRADRPWPATGLGLVIGGALGNLVDRLVYGRVADFFDVHLLSREFFTCNLADVAISLGVAVLLLDLVWESRVSRLQEAE